MIEKLAFTLFAIALFSITFLKLIQKNDTSYVYMLAIEFIGNVLNFIEIIKSTMLPITLRIVMYVFAVILPIILIWLESIKHINFSELFCMAKVQILEKSNKHEKAKQTVLRFLNKNKNSYRIYKLLAQFYEKEENYEAAISAYRKVTELNPQDKESYYHFAIVLNKGNQKQNAINLLQEMLKNKPEEEKITMLLGDILFEQQEYKEAISVYMSALRYHPGSYDLYYNLGMTYTMLNDFQKAKEFYYKAAQINSLAYNAKLNLGQIALLYGELDEAESYFMESIKEEEIEAGSYYYLAQIAILKGEKEKAINYMNLAVQLNENVYSIMVREPLFEPIKYIVTPPQKTTESPKTMKTLSQKERKVDKHLAKMRILTDSLNSSASGTIKKQMQKQILKEQLQKE